MDKTNLLSEETPLVEEEKEVPSSLNVDIILSQKFQVQPIQIQVEVKHEMKVEDVI